MLAAAPGNGDAPTSCVERAPDASVGADVAALTTAEDNAAASCAAAAAPAGAAAEASAQAPQDEDSARPLSPESNVSVVGQESDPTCAAKPPGADAEERTAALLRQLVAPEPVAQRAAAEAIASLCAGSRDAPDEPAACAALLAQGAVPALRRAASSADVQGAALAALAALTNVCEDARAAVIDAGGLPQLAALLQCAADSSVLEGAAHVLWYVSRSAADQRAFRTSGALAAVLELVRRAADGACAPTGGCACLVVTSQTALEAALAAACNACENSRGNCAAVRDAGVIPSFVALLKESTPVNVIDLDANALYNFYTWGDEAVKAVIQDAGAAAALAALLPPCSAWPRVMRPVVQVLKAIDTQWVFTPELADPVISLLRSEDTASLLEGTGAAREWCSGSSCQPDYPDACKSLLTRGVLPALLRLVDTAEPAAGATVEVQADALASLSALLCMLQLARAAVAANDNILRVIAEALRAARRGDALCSAADVLFYVTERGDSANAMRRSGALEALVEVVRRAAAGDDSICFPPDKAVVVALSAICNACKQGEMCGTLASCRTRAS